MCCIEAPPPPHPGNKARLPASRHASTATLTVLISVFIVLWRYRRPAAEDSIQGPILHRLVNKRVGRRQELVVALANSPGQLLLSQRDWNCGEAFGGIHSRQIPD